MRFFFWYKLVDKKANNAQKLYRLMGMPRSSGIRNLQGIIEPPVRGAPLIEIFA
jgi:hypothetical protein